MSALVLQILTYAIPLVVGYLLRHYGISIPGLPAPVPTAPGSTPANSADHAGLLQQVLGIGEAEAKVLLKTALQDTLQKGLADLKSATQPQTPKA